MREDLGFFYFFFLETTIKSNFNIFSTVLQLARSVLKMCLPECPCCTWVPVYFWSCVVIYQNHLFKEKSISNDSILSLKVSSHLNVLRKDKIPAMGSRILAKFYTLLILRCSLIYSGCLVALFLFICTFKPCNVALLSSQRWLWYCCLWNDPVHSLMSSC